MAQLSQGTLAHGARRMQVLGRLMDQGHHVAAVLPSHRSSTSDVTDMAFGPFAAYYRVSNDILGIEPDTAGLAG